MCSPELCIVRPSPEANAVRQIAEIGALALIEIERFKCAGPIGKVLKATGGRSQRTVALPEEAVLLALDLSNAHRPCGRRKWCGCAAIAGATFDQMDADLFCVPEALHVPRYVNWKQSKYLNVLRNVGLRTASLHNIPCCPWF